jgi:hypothetical protein
MAASDRLLALVPNAQVWLRRVGSRYARRFGARGPSWRHDSRRRDGQRQALIRLTVRAPPGLGYSHQRNPLMRVLRVPQA